MFNITVRVLQLSEKNMMIISRAVSELGCCSLSQDPGSLVLFLVSLGFCFMMVVMMFQVLFVNLSLFHRVQFCRFPVFSV